MRTVFDPQPRRHLSQLRPVFSTFTSITEFHYFKNLPKEIRLMIWRMIDLNHDRNVRVNIHPEQDEGREAVLLFKTMTSIPCILHVCHESREEALKVYVSIFRDYRPQTDTIVGRLEREAPFDGSQCVYINPEVDTLYIEMPNRPNIQLGGWAFELFNILIGKQHMTAIDPTSTHALFIDHAWEKLLLEGSTAGNWNFQGARVAVGYDLDIQGRRQMVMIIKRFHDGEEMDGDKLLRQIGVRQSIMVTKFMEITWWHEAWTLFLLEMSLRVVVWKYHRRQRGR